MKIINKDADFLAVNAYFQSEFEKMFSGNAEFLETDKVDNHFGKIIISYE